MRRNLVAGCGALYALVYDFSLMSLPMHLKSGYWFITMCNIVLISFGLTGGPWADRTIKSKLWGGGTMWLHDEDGCPCISMYAWHGYPLFSIFLMIFLLSQRAHFCNDKAAFILLHGSSLHTQTLRNDERMDKDRGKYENTHGQWWLTEI